MTAAQRMSSPTRSSQAPERGSRLASRGRMFSLLCVAALLLLTSPAVCQELDLSSVEVGDSLADVLRSLQDQGAPIVFTTNLVTSDMIVSAGDLDANAPWRQALTELLAPHGLAVQRGPNGTLTVVRRDQLAPGVGSIRGSVISRRDGTPIAGAVISIAGLSHHRTSDQAGDFVFAGVPAGTHRLRFRRAGFVVTETDSLVLAAGETLEIRTVLDPAPISAESLLVTPSHATLLREEPDHPTVLTRDDIESLPHLGGDLFRALTLLPGISANDATAEFNIRGGRRDTSLIMVDGQELFAPYHLADYDNALSIVAPDTVGSVDLMTGAFSARYGDRMAGVLNIVTRQPTDPVSTTIGLSVVDAHVGSSGLFDEGRGSWVVQARRGSIDLLGRLLGDGSPSFWDLFGKLDLQLSDSNALRANLLVTDDRLRIREVLEDSDKDIETDYATGYSWLTHTGILSNNLFVESAISQSGVRQDRRGIEIEEDVSFAINDNRELSVISARQGWTLQAGSDHSLSLGYEARWFDTEYDYVGAHVFDNPLAEIRDLELESTVFVDEFSERHGGIYASDRFHATDSLTVDLGLRFDHHTQTGESLWSPRVALARAVGKASVIRAAWGRFHQSQRPYELLVEDGDTTFYPVERAEQWVLGYERLLDLGSESTASLEGVRFELYERHVENPLPRYENLFEVLNTFPEVEPDRVRVEPDSATARGAEVFLRGNFGERTGWWLTYAWSSTEDRIEGEDAPRPYDQPHSLNLDFNHRFGDAWRLNLAWRYHTGWPTTPISVEEVADEDGESEFVPVLGARNSERFPNYHRLDMRLSRRWLKPKLGVELYMDVQNVYDRRNVAGFDIEIDDESGELEKIEEEWAGILPSIGVTFRF